MVLALSLALSTALACPGDDASHTAAATTATSGEKSGCPLSASASTVAALPADGTHGFLTVSGMHCGTCADKVHAALLAVPGVKGAKVDLATKRVEVAYDAASTNMDKLVAAVDKTGQFTAQVATN